MTPLAHNPQDIMDEVANLASLPLHLHNISFARDLFVEIYRAWNGRNTHDDLRQLLNSGQIRTAMRALDIYFFGKALTSTTPTRNWTALKDLHVEGNIFAEGHKGHAVRPNQRAFGVIDFSERGEATIYIDAFSPDGSPRTTKQILETLVHEMAHAIYGSFACECQSCDGTDPEVLGPNGHGRLWVQLLERMRDTIRSWDEALGDFYDEDLEWYERYEQELEQSLW